MAKITTEDKQVYIKTSIIVGIVLVLIISWLWWTAIVTSKQNVFNRMFAQSLQTYGVTKTVNQKDANGTLEERSQAQFGAQNVVEVLTTIKQDSEDNKANVVTRTIGTPTATYISYDQIDVTSNAKQADFSQLIKKWGVQTKAEGGNAVFAEAVYGVVLFGNVSGQQKAELTAMMRDKQIYTTDFSKTEQMDIDGRLQYVYDVQIATKSYVELLKKYDSMLGMNNFQELNPDDYNDSASINVKMYIDKNAQTLTRLTYEDGGREENFSGYGLRRNVDIPEDTISREELEVQLNKVLQNSQ